MKTEIFADGVGQIHFAGGMVRFDFFTLQPKADGTSEPQIADRVVMPPNGFLRMFDSMRQLVDKLVEGGVLQRAEK